MTSHTDIIKEKLNILDVVSPYVVLEKAGKTYKGKSPFTNEKTPSFFVSPEKGFFYCFSSGKGGDIFNFIQEIEHVDFREALKILADKAGVELNQQSLETQSVDKKRFEILDRAAKLYEVEMRKNKDVVDYLLSRGLTKETMVAWRIGFVPNQWRLVYDYLASKKYSDTDIESVGLIVPKDGGGYYDRFRSRVMFPLFDSRSRVVGFSGRIFNEEQEDVKGAKYVNSPEGPLFDKSKVLYGYHTAKNAMSKKDQCILVEGQFDVILSQQAGYTNTVAISGTGLTNEHVQMIKRFTKNIVLALDSDNAGIKATRRSVLVAYQNGMNVQIIMLPDGQDPADTIQQNPSKWDVAVADTQDYIDYRLALFSKSDHTFDEKKKLIEEDIFEFVNLIQSPIVADRVLQKIALFLGVSIESVRQEFNQFQPQEVLEQVSSQDESEDQHAVQDLDPRKTILLHYVYLQEHYTDTFLTEERGKIEEHYNQVYEQTLASDLDTIPDSLKHMHLFILEQKLVDRNQEFLIKTIHHLLDQEMIRSYEEQSQSLLEQIRIAESQNNTDQALLLLQENKKIREHIETLKNTHHSLS